MKRILQLILLVSLISFGLNAQSNGIKIKGTYSYKAQTIKKGSHSTKWDQRFWFPTRRRDFEVHGFLYGGFRYDLGDSDQLDWNKYHGVQGDKYQPHGKTTMVGWRHNLGLDSTEWTFYHHNISNKEQFKAVGGVPGYIKPDNIIRTKPGEAPIYKVDFNGRKEIRLALVYGEKMITDTIYFDKKIDRRFTYSNFYFGGNRTAPETVSAAKSIRPLQQIIRTEKRLKIRKLKTEIKTLKRA